jgi:chorismate dehydratase
VKSSPGPRIGSVSYLNALPLTCGLESRVRFTVPARLAELLREGELEVALVSITEALAHREYQVVDGVAIASAGPVRSVFLAHRVPLEGMTEVYCDPASLSSVGLLRVLLGERGARPVFRKLADYRQAQRHDAVLLIGDRALDFAVNPGDHAIWDLGAAWFETTRLPFVHAAWTLRQGFDDPGLGTLLRQARDEGLVRLEELVQARHDYTVEFRRRYLTENVRFGLGEAEKEGLRRFAELLRVHGNTPVFEPRFVQ